MTLADFPAEVDLLGRTFRVLNFHPIDPALANEGAVARLGAGTLVLVDAATGARVDVRVETDGSVYPSSLGAAPRKRGRRPRSR